MSKGVSPNILSKKKKQMSLFWATYVHVHLYRTEQMMVEGLAQRPSSGNAGM